VTWRLPKKIPVAGQIPSARDLNDGFRPFTELDGHLAEGNFSSDMATQLAQHTDIEEDVALRTTGATASCYVGGPVTTYPNNSSDNDSLVSIKIGPGWSTVGTLTRTLHVDVGPVIVMASFQAARREPGDGQALEPSAFFMHAQYGIRVDGNLQETTVVGDQDTSSEGEWMEFGIWSYLQGVDIFAILDVGPGKHTIEVVAHAEGDIVSLVGDRENILVYNRELRVIEVK